jgi:hypothetical protein
MGKKAVPSGHRFRISGGHRGAAGRNDFAQKL